MSEDLLADGLVAGHLDSERRRPGVAVTLRLHLGRVRLPRGNLQLHLPLLVQMIQPGDGVSKTTATRIIGIKIPGADT